MPEPIEQKEREPSLSIRDLGIRDYLLVIYKRKWVILAVFMFVFILNAIRISREVPVYEATASVRIVERKPVAALLTEWISYTPGDPIASQAKIIESFPVVERAARDLGLVSEDASSEELMSVVGSLRGKFSVKPVRETNVIEIVAEDTDREKVALIANKIAESYIQENLKEKTKQAHTVKEFIRQQLNAVGDKLRVAEEALKEFRSSGGAAGIAIPLQNKLADLESEKAKMLRTYTEAHPNVGEINEEIKVIREQIKLMPDLEIQFARLTRDIEINENLYKALQEKYEDARIAEAEKIPDVTLTDPASVPSSPVRPNKMAGMTSAIFVGLVLGLVVGFTIEQLDTSIGTIEDVERLLALPVLGVIPFLRPTESTIKISLKKRLFSKKERDNLRLMNLKKQLLIYYSNQSSVFEAYRILRTNIIIEVLKEQSHNKTILISSAGPQEGKSINVANLGICFAQAGYKTLIIDLDLRRSMIDKIFAFPSRRQVGLTDILRQTVKIEDGLRSFTDLLVGSGVEFEKILATPGIDNLSLLLAGSSSFTPTELIESPEMISLLKELKEKFDIILFDSPPILAVTDATLFAPKMDAVLLVYKVGKTASYAIMRAKKQLEAVGVMPKGIILNNISPDVEMHSGYYSYHYRRYYSTEKEKEKEKE